MKKGLSLLTLGLISVLAFSGCGCNKVSESTYENAVNSFNNTDAISYVRSEREYDNADVSKFTNTITNADYIFERARDGNVKNFKYNIKRSIGSAVDLNVTYHYNSIGGILYKKVPGQYVSEKKSFENHFNVNFCDGDRNCLIAMPSNMAPIYTLNNLSDFSIEESNGNAIAKYKAACPAFESCNTINEKIDYVLTISNKGLIKHLSYKIVKEKTTIEINYEFKNYGSNNVEITLPGNTSDYIPGKIEKVL